MLLKEADFIVVNIVLHAITSEVERRFYNLWAIFI